MLASLWQFFAAFFSFSSFFSSFQIIPSYGKILIEWANLFVYDFAINCRGERPGVVGRASCLPSVPMVEESAVRGVGSRPNGLAAFGTVLRRIRDWRTGDTLID